MIPFFLVTGFLGSGKTTLLKRILKKYAGEKRIAVIQNEFAPSGTDGAILKQEGNDFKLVEINNGSVFCVCKLGNFISSLAGVVDNYQPEMLILEASGLSDPINILELLESEQIRDQLTLKEIITIVDAVNFERSVGMLQRIRHQVMIADTLIINKADLFKGDQKKLSELIRKINPFASMVTTSHCDIHLDFIMEERIAEHRGAQVFGQKESEGRPEIRAAVLRTNRKISSSGLQSFIEILAAKCLRVKGFVIVSEGKTIMVECVFGSVRFKEIHEYSGPSELIAFGKEITPGLLNKMFIEST